MKTFLKSSLSLAFAALAAWGIHSASAEKPAAKPLRAEFINSPPVADPVTNAAEILDFQQLVLAILAASIEARG